MDDFDLDIDNYGLEDILNLFHLDYKFEKSGMKKAKAMALKTHPDKSGLDQKVFLFFLKAYKMCETIYKFRVKRQDLNLNTTFKYENLETLNEKQKEQLLYKKLNGKSAKEFNKWFNDMFDKVKVRSEDVDSGYGDWFKSSEDMDKGKISSMSAMEDEFEKRKMQVKPGITCLWQVEGRNSISDASEKIASIALSLIKK
mgnify:CR=1 FL=1